MQIESIDGDLAIVNVAETRRQISVSLLEGPNVGDYVLVHAGFAIQKIDEQQAEETILLLNKMAELDPPPL